MGLNEPIQKGDISRGNFSIYTFSPLFFVPLSRRRLLNLNVFFLMEKGNPSEKGTLLGYLCHNQSRYRD